MATRKAALSFAIQRFKGFWSQFKKSKRGMIGLVIIAFFVIVALLAPVIAPHEPINPMAEVGQWPGFGPATGRKIAMQLCYPAWYKYLPNIPKGETILVEEFYNVVIYMPELKTSFQLFGRLEEKGLKNATDDVITLTKRVSKLYNITATFPNGTVIQLTEVDYTTFPRNPREIRINKMYEEDTTFKVVYSTGVDTVENLKVVQDAIFASSTSLNEWTVTSPDTSFSVAYDSTKGFNDGTGINGCLSISFSPTSIPSSTTYINLSRPFSYPYWEPPRWLLTHFSYKLEGSSSASITFYIVRETDGSQYFYKTYALTPSSAYTHYYSDIYAPEVRAALGTDYPLDIIFAHPANYSFRMQITFNNPTSDTKLYLDNVHCFIYGNIYGWLGTDNDYRLPRDIFSTLVYGTQVSLIVGILSAVFSTLIGLFLGLISGYIGGIVDEGIMRFADLLLVLPTLPLFIVLIVALRSIGTFMSIWNIIIIITFFGWMGFARSVRSMVISLRERAFIEAAKASGAGTMHIINRHVLPNVFSLVYITLATSVPGAIVLEASLSWLGLGDPLVASWGKVLYDFQTAGVAITKGLGEYWFWVFPACVAIALLATAFILIGYALDEILNPRLRERR